MIICGCSDSVGTKVMSICISLLLLFSSAFKTYCACDSGVRKGGVGVALGDVGVSLSIFDYSFYI
jgi:hypothetical protein